MRGQTFPFAEKSIFHPFRQKVYSGNNYWQVPLSPNIYEQTNILCSHPTRENRVITIMSIKSSLQRKLTRKFNCILFVQLEIFLHFASRLFKRLLNLYALDIIKLHDCCYPVLNFGPRHFSTSEKWKAFEKCRLTMMKITRKLKFLIFLSSRFLNFSFSLLFFKCDKKLFSCLAEYSSGSN